MVSRSNKSNKASSKDPKLMKKSNPLGRDFPASIFLRYLILLGSTYFFFFSQVFYNLFLKLTIYPVHFFLGLFYDTLLIYDSLIINQTIIEIVPACVAVSAYFLLFALNLLTPNIRKRLNSILFSFLILLVFNILRIFILAILFINNSSGFDILHKTLWYSLNLIVVIGIWFLTAYIFKFKDIPVYSDFKLLINKIRAQHLKPRNKTNKKYKKMNNKLLIKLNKTNKKYK